MTERKNYCTECGWSGGYDNHYCHNPKHRELTGEYPITTAVRSLTYNKRPCCPDWKPTPPPPEPKADPTVKPWWAYTEVWKGVGLFILIMFLAALCSGCEPACGACREIKYDCSRADPQEIFNFKRDCYASDEYSEVCDRKANKLFCVAVETPQKE